MKGLIRVLAIVLAFTVTAVYADTVSWVRIYTDDYYSYDNLVSNSSLDIAAAEPVEYVDVIIPQSTLDELATDGYDYEYLMYDIHDPANYAGKGYSSYHNYDEMLDELNDLEDNYPNIIKLSDLGTGRVGSHDLWLVKLSDDVNNEDPTEPNLMVCGVHHAREPMSLEVPLYFLDYLCTGYGTDPDATRIINNLELYVIPNVNPEGYNNDDVEYERKSWRKNGYDYDGDGNPFEEYYFGAPYGEGVDLNRNYSFQWGGSGASHTWWDPTYCGTAAFSEPENQIIGELATDIGFVSAFSFHSYQGLILRPWGYTGQDPPSGDLAVFDDIGEAYRETLHDELGRWYTYQAGYDLYQTNGDFVDYMYGEHGCFAFTVELNFENEGGFYPDESYIEPTCSAHNEALKEWCGYIIDNFGNPGIEDGGPATPNAYALYDAAPNPANGAATFSFALPETAEVTLDLYDVKGRKVMNLANDTYESGENEITANVGSLSAGVYLYKLTAGDYSSAKKLVVK